MFLKRLENLLSSAGNHIEISISQLIFDIYLTHNAS